jgi:hypothetical protein
MSYQYKMVQIPPNIQISAKQKKGQEAAVYLEQIVNKMAEQDWEFYRVDTIGVQTDPGCLASLFGHKAELVSYYVVTFRKEK